MCSFENNLSESTALADIHTFLYCLNPADVAFLERQPQAYLCPLELDRYHRYRSVLRRSTFLCARYLVKKLLADRLSCSISDVKFVLGPNGKPELSSPQPLPWHFNLSHSGPWLMCALSEEHAVGVDLESQRDHDDLKGLMERTLTTSELDNFARYPQERQACLFYRSWVLKEAYTKLAGTGIWHTLQEVAVDPDACKMVPPHDHVAVRFLGVSPPLVAAVAYPAVQQAVSIDQHYLSRLCP